MTTEAGAVQKIRICMVIAVVAAAALSIPCSAQSICPWLNVATASGALGGPATMEVVGTGDKVEACTFQVQNASPNKSLRISVITTVDAQNAGHELAPYERHCTSSSTSLKGIGNEAVLCRDDTRKSSGEQVIGRVRDSIFIVAIGTSTRRDSEARNDPLAEKVEEIAEQVAGALF